MKASTIQKTETPKPMLGLFLCLLAATVCVKGFETMLLAAEETQETKVFEELNAEEKRELITKFIQEGDELFQAKEYDKANAAYERVFIMEPDNKIASERIDQLKKQMLKEGRSETQLVTRVYDAEIDARVQYYWDRTQKLIEEKRWGEARLTLEKILLLSPMHRRAQKLYKEVKSKTSLGDK